MTKRYTFTLALAATFALLIANNSAEAATIAVTSNSAGSVNGNPFSLGYRFNVDSDIAMTAVGKFDVEGDNDVGSASKIALFNWDTGAQLFETTMAGAVEEETGFYDTFFVDIS